MRRRILPVVFVLLASCGGEPANVAAPAAAPTPGPVGLSGATPPAPPPPPRDDGRLPVTATPVRYALSLRVDPTQPRFSGVTTIELKIDAPTRYVVLNANDMHVSSAVARVGSSTIEATTSMRAAHGSTNPEELVLAFAQPVPAGTALLEITYDAPFSANLSGLYRVKEDDVYYAFTQFESTDARRAFPCFDEPGFKTAYDITIASPRGTMALANSPEASHEDASDGFVVHHFATTRPLPSYLVAFAVGDFDVAQGQTSPFPIRVVTTKGKSGLAGIALDAAASLIAKLGDYFGIRYPYEKLDLVAVPDFDAGAMENPGLVTFRDEILLLDPDHATTAMKRDQAETIAHEFAHQWFGDLVTMQWWDDVWLNEGFATWAEAHMVDAWKPSFGATIDQVADVQFVMDTDALSTARAVRQPVSSTGEAIEAFDGLTYEKGAAVLRMLESWLGPDTFRRGVQRYLNDNAWKNAKADNLFHALEFVSAQNVSDMAHGFLDKPGVPSVQVNWKCGGKLELRESEWRPLGEGAQPVGKWTLPVCVTSDAQKAKACFTVGAEPITRDLGGRCPTWLFPNAEEAGYYRFVLDRPQLLALARSEHSLDPVERLGLVSNAWAAVRQGAIEPATLLDLLTTFDGDKDRHVLEAIVDTLRGIDRALVDDTDRPAFQRFAMARLVGHKAALGWEPRAKGASENDDRAIERQIVLSAMGRVARDPTTLAEAEKYAQAWLKDPRSVPADTAAIAVPLASIRAGAPRLQELRAAAKSARTPEDRVLSLRAMGAFDDPAVLEQAWSLVFTGEIRQSDFGYLFSGARSTLASAARLYAWEKKNWSALTGIMNGPLGREGLVSVAGSLCSRQDHDDAKAFFSQAAAGMDGLARPLSENLERSELCVALRDHGSQDVAAYFRGRR